jgi:phosphoglycolate phosphatase
MKFDFYLFDLDGTLLNLGNIGAYADQILVETLRKLGVYKVPNIDERKVLWHSGRNFQQVLNKWGLSESLNFWKYFDETDFEKRKILLKNEKITLYDDVNTVLKIIYNHKEKKKLAICTNTANYIADYFLKHFKISKYFHEIYSMEYNNQEFAKPSPRGILIILENLRFNSQKHKALMIGDSINDIKAAKAANISSCLINNRKDSERYKNWIIQPDYIVEHLYELIDL